MAKAKAKPTTKPGVPAALERHIQKQQDAATRISCLLDLITPAIDGITGEDAHVADSAGVALRHVNDLVRQLGIELHCVTVNRIASETVHS